MGDYSNKRTQFCIKLNGHMEFKSQEYPFNSHLHWYFTFIGITPGYRTVNFEYFFLILIALLLLF